jgi:Holliday junction resolvasome RuvABC endonuclease subunit
LWKGYQMRVLGIDPGVTGAWAIVEVAPELGSKPVLVGVGDLPAKSVKMSKRVALRLDAPRVGELFDRLTDEHQLDRIIVERLSGGPGITSSTAFSLGMTAGIIDTLLAERRLEFSTVPPSSWKRALLAPAGKAASRQHAVKLFGSNKGWEREKDHNRAEAAMIALWGALR